MTGPLFGKVAAITGGAGGIGTEIARQLCAAGARVFSLDFVESSAVESIHCDVRDDASVEAAISAIRERAGGLDIVVHAAGVARDAVVWKLAVDDWDFVHAVNLRGAFLLARHAVPLMRERGGGRIVLIGSINGSRGKRGTAAYSSSKAGLIGLAKSVCRETGRFGILVNVVEPGWVRTPLTESLPSELREAALAETVTGELVEPCDVAAVVTFLCGPGARRITGQILRVDSGQLIGAN
jgi:NAD(P)-dependent dehydrogenase (short-subunit alcohol dehydrogenase family)